MNNSISTKTEESDALPMVPSLLFLASFLLTPVIILLVLSFFQYDPIEVYSVAFTVENYIRLISEQYYTSIIIYTLQISVISTFFCVVFGYPIAYALATTSELKKSILLFIILLPLMVGLIVRVYGWMILLGRDGILNQLAQSVFKTQLILTNTTTAVVIGFVGVLIPFFVLPSYSSINGIEESTLLAAQNLGANKFRTFWHITLPLSIPGIVTGSIFCFTLSMSAIVTPKLLGGRTDVTIGALTFDTALADLNWPFASAMAITMAVTTMTLIYICLSVFGSRMEVVQ
jgi:ABC-type spermidine/putrescine transport system permease subunit I